MAVGERWRTRAVGWIRDRLPPWARRALDDLSGHDLFLHAAGLAFYAIVSVVPLSVVVMWLTSVAVGESRVQRMARVLSAIAPENLGADRAVLRVARLGSGLGIAAILTALWPATAYGSGLARAFRRLSPKPSEELTGIWGRGLLLLVLLPLFVLGSMLGAFGASALFGEGALRVLGYALGLVLAFAGSAAASAIVYRVFPPESLRWPQILRATVITAVGVALLTVAFALIVGLGGDFQRHYAISGVAAIVLLAVWLFLANALLLAGYRVALRR